MEPGQTGLDGDYFPWGGEQYVFTNTCSQNYKFTSKERDPDMGIDDFGARFYKNTMARFYSPDWSATVEPVPYAKLNNPQSLNLYTYVLDNPLSLRDADGHEVGADTLQELQKITSDSGSVAQNQANGAGQAHGAGQQGDVAAANHYLSRSKEMRLVQKAFKSGHFHLEIIHLPT